MVLSEILRFTLPSSAASSSAFLRLRNQVSSWGIKGQYFGYVLPTHGFPMPKRKDEMCWVVQWPEDSNERTSDLFRSQVNELAQENARSLFFQFKDADMENVARGLEAPVCEFAIISLIPSTPFSNPDFKHSMHKTFTDCYLAQGFTGGAWCYSMNTNDADGLQPPANAVEPKNQVLKKEERRLAYYYLGWESVELHDAYAATPLFDEEIDKLKPYFGPGTGAWYVSFEKHA